jgi:hypothetical protein
MSRLSKKVLLVLACVLPLPASAMPSIASAANWGVVGTTHDLDQLPTNPLAFISTDGTLGVNCAGFSLHATVTSTAVLTVTAGTFANCMGTGSLGTPCTTTFAGRFPWQTTGLSTTNIQIHNIHATVLYENTPGNATACPLNNVTATTTGTLASPNHIHWIGVSHRETFINATGLIIHSVLGSLSMSISGSLTDRGETLTLS